MSFSFNKLNFFRSGAPFVVSYLYLFIYYLFITYILIYSFECVLSYGQSISMCVSGDGKSLRLKNVATRRTQAKADDVICPCALDLDESRRAVKHLRARARARFLRTHLPPLTASHTETLCPCDGTCSARASRLPMFSRRGSEGKKHLRSFRWIFNMRVTLRTPASRLVCSTTLIACEFVLRTM